MAIHRFNMEDIVSRVYAGIARPSATTPRARVRGPYNRDKRDDRSPIWSYWGYCPEDPTRPMPVRSPSALASSAVFLEQAGVVSSSVLRRRIGIGGQDGCVFLSGANPGTPRIHPSTR